MFAQCPQNLEYFEYMYIKRYIYIKLSQLETSGQTEIKIFLILHFSTALVADQTLDLWPQKIIDFYLLYLFRLKDNLVSNIETQHLEHYRILQGICNGQSHNGGGHCTAVSGRGWQILLAINKKYSIYIMATGDMNNVLQEAANVGNQLWVLSPEDSPSSILTVISKYDNI